MAKHKTIPRPEIIWRLVPSSEICKQLGISYSTLKRWRKTGAILEGIHWTYNPTTKTRILWNLDLMRDFMANGANSPAHVRSIGTSHLYQVPDVHKKSPTGETDNERKQ
jgi:hypothetical protein